MGGLEPCACSTSRMICARAVSAPTLVARKVNEPVVFMVAPITSAPAALEHRHGLAGEHRFVDRRRAAHDHAVDRHLLAGAHDDQVAGDDVRHGHVDLGAAALHAGRLRLQADERLDGGAGLALGARLEQAPEQDQRDDQGGRVEVHRHAQALVLEESREEHAEDAVEVGRRRAHGDQRVHGRGAVAQRRPRGGVELPAHPELHRRGQRPEHVAVVQPRREEGEPVGLHGAREDDDAQGEADDDLELEGAVGRGARRLAGVDGGRRAGRRAAAGSSTTS